LVIAAAALLFPATAAPYLMMNSIVDKLFIEKLVYRKNLLIRAVPDLLLRNPAGAGFCRICKANPARAGAGAGFRHIISHQ